MQTVMVTKMSSQIPAESGLESIFDQQGYGSAKPKYRDKTIKREGSRLIVRLRQSCVRVPKECREDKHARTLDL
jgi:hypothetical protein